MYEESMTWENAEKFCQAEGGHLGNREASGGECVRTALQTCFRNGGQTAQAYTGLSDVITLDTFRWSSDNRETNYTVPQHTVPRCLFVNVNANILAVNPCTFQRSYICERNLSKRNLSSKALSTNHVLDKTSRSILPVNVIKLSLTTASKHNY